MTDISILKDREIVEHLSKAPRAQDCAYGADRPMVIELQYDGRTSQEIHRLNKAIEDAISKGSAVLVRGWEPTPALDFNLSDIKLFRPTVTQPVIVQGTYTSVYEAWRNNGHG
jgi:hypothetical protein